MATGQVKRAVQSALAVGAFVMAGCGSDSPNQTYSAPEPRVATYSAGSWTVANRPDDAFSTYNSLFATGENGWPVALRSRGGETTFGRWNGAEWEVEQVQSDPVVDITSVDDGDQLISGVLTVASDGSPHAMFVTEARRVYYAGKRAGDDGESRWVILPLSNVEQACYDITVAPDGTPRLLFADAVNERTYVAEIDAAGQLVPSEVLDRQVCGSVAVADNGTVGAILWVPNDGSAYYTAKLYEKAQGATAWTGADVATNGNPTCSYCYIPELAYRGDNVPVVEYVDNSLAVYLAERQTDGTFTRNTLSAPQQDFQLTRLKRAPDGSLGAAVILDNSSIGIAMSAVPAEEDDKTFSYTRVTWTGTEANTPRLTFTQGSDGKSHSFVSFWDADGLYAVPPGGVPMLVDPNGNEGYLLGGFVAVGPEGIPQVFYSEVHLVD